MTEITNCIFCGSDKLNQALDLGIGIVKCAICDLLQSKYQTNKDYSQVYRPTENDREDYLLAVVQKTREVVEIKPGEKVLDIGCNDGILLGWYNKGVVTVGVDPSVKAVQESLKSGSADVAICDPFDGKELSQHFSNMGVDDVKFKVITAVDVLDIIDNPKQFFKSVKDLLKDDGVFTLQTLYLGNALQTKSDKIFNKDRTAYYLVGTIGQIIKEANLEVSGAEFTPSYMRLFITHPGVDICPDDPDRRYVLYRNWQFKLVEEVRNQYNVLETYLEFESKLREEVVPRSGRIA